MNAEAKKCLENKNYDGALYYYRIALSSCSPMEAAVIHSNLAHVFLVLESYESAYLNANACVEINSRSAKVMQRVVHL